MECVCVYVCVSCGLRAFLRVGVFGLSYSNITYNTVARTLAIKVTKRGYSLQFLEHLYEKIKYYKKTCD